MKTYQVPYKLNKAPKDLKLVASSKSIFKLINNKYSFEVSDHFTKAHKRKFNSFGNIHFNNNKSGFATKIIN